MSQLPHPRQLRLPSGAWWLQRPLLASLVAGVIGGLGYSLSLAGAIGAEGARWIYWTAIPLAAFDWVRDGLAKLLREREVGIEMLMLAAAVGSAVLGMWGEACALVVLFGIAEGLEHATEARTKASVQALLARAPKQARLLRDGHESMLEATSLKPGDRFLVRPGESIATDGIVRAGRSSVDESSLTGESMPVAKEVSMAAFAGTLNLQGALEIEVTKTVEDNTLSRIIHLVLEAQESKGKTQSWIERFGRRYTPAVLLTAVAIALWPLISGGDPQAWIHRSIVLLVAAAPCALIISTPVCMAAAIGAAGRKGLLIKGGAQLETLACIRTVALDKTGTLTQGNPTVSALETSPGAEDELLAIVAGIESRSEHPLAQAILREAADRGVIPAPIENFRAVPGFGAEAMVAGKRWGIGSPRWFSDTALGATPWHDRAQQLEAKGQTVMLIGASSAVQGLIAVRDPIRAQAREMVETLHVQGMRTVMLTGDNLRVAATVAASLEISVVHAGLTPEAKVKILHQIQQEGPVLMVGDGVNDAPALATASCGMAIGAIGRDAAMEAADVVLLAPDLRQIPGVLRLARRVRRLSHQNIALSVAAVAVLIPLSLVGWIGASETVIVHEVTELLAVANGVRAGRPRW